MNYIREELLRQQALLVILLTGQRPEPLEQADAPSADSARDLLEQEDIMTRLAAETRQNMTERRYRQEGDGGRRTPFSRGEAAGAAALWAALTADAPGEQAGTWEAARPLSGRSFPAGADRSGRAAEEASSRPAVPGAAVASGRVSTEAGEVRLVTELRQAEERPGVDPAAMSLAFQRDARRYDGGFRLY